MKRMHLFYIVPAILMIILIAVLDIPLFITYFIVSFLFLIRLLVMKREQVENRKTTDQIFLPILIFSFFVLGILESFF
ncbi:hypothetical protein BBEV_2601 [Salisediminibacterium beveridgei]|uniref:Uncharacterized protein n=1 Tax=Salisediminibacterium beveridgei TaxID=632773 RepID=A0A1D7QY63_9BACI|nr:hypothetical protein BBEV_2601 [Salisediminibacterium beveridgei]